MGPSHALLKTVHNKEKIRNNVRFLYNGMWFLHTVQYAVAFRHVVGKA